MVVSIGHSGATYEQAVMAYANGARSMTHVYKRYVALQPPCKRSGGAAYRIRTMYGEIICDAATPPPLP